MAEPSLASARRQNDSLEKSLQTLRGKLAGLGSAPRNQSLSQGGRINLKHLETRGLAENPALSNTVHRNTNVGGKGSRVPKPSVRREAANPKPRVSFDRGVQSKEQAAFGKYSRTEGNYFDDFRSKVMNIRNARERDTAEQNVTSLDNAPATKSKDKPDAWRPGEARKVLVSKIERQDEYIDELKSTVQSLTLQNQALHDTQDELRAKLRALDSDRRKQEKLHQQALANIEARRNYAQRHQVDPFVASDRDYQYVASGRDYAHGEEQDKLDLVAELDETKQENAQLRHRITEITERVHLLNSIQEQRIRTLESKLQSSTEVAKYYCESLGGDWQDDVEDSTEEILFGAQQDTTMDLLKGSPALQRGASGRGRKSLRSYFLAVLFTVRLQKDMEARRLWEPYLHEEVAI